MGLTTVFAAASGILAATAGGVGALVFGAPVEAAPVIALGAGLGAAGASAVSNAIVGGAFNGKGPSAGVAGLFFMAATHITAVPAAAVLTAKAALKLTGLSA